jgi:hypothetical protein
VIEFAQPSLRLDSLSFRAPIKAAEAEDAKRSFTAFSRFSLRPLRLSGNFCEAFLTFHKLRHRLEAAKGDGGCAPPAQPCSRSGKCETLRNPNSIPQALRSRSGERRTHVRTIRGPLCHSRTVWPSEPLRRSVLTSGRRAFGHLHAADAACTICPERASFRGVSSHSDPWRGCPFIHLHNRHRGSSKQRGKIPAFSRHLHSPRAHDLLAQGAGLLDNGGACCVPFEP